MEVQISPASQFNGSNQNMIRASASSKSYEPTSKRFKSDLTFQCIVCSDVYEDPNILYEHMKLKHQELYEVEDGENGFESDSEHELSDEEYLDLSRLLEPICELRQVDDEEDNDNDDDKKPPSLHQPSDVIAQLMQNTALGMPMNEEHLRLQIQLQMQLQHHLLQLQANSEKRQQKQNVHRKSNNQSMEKPLSIRKFECNFDDLQKLIKFVLRFQLKVQVVVADENCQHRIVKHRHPNHVCFNALNVIAHSYLPVIWQSMFDHIPKTNHTNAVFAKNPLRISAV